LSLSVSYGQEKDTIPLSEKYILIKIGDTLTIDLDEVKLLPKNKFSSNVDIHYYYWLKKKVFKSYPYAVLASKRLDTLAARLSRIKSKRRRKKYIKIAQRYMEGEFTDQLKKMTRTEGRILIKLIHRQTGRTTFSHIKELRSGWKAFWYNASANIFKLSLKLQFNPEHINEDFLVEDILQRAFSVEALEEHSSKLPFNFEKIYATRGGQIDVSEYKLLFKRLRKKRSGRRSQKKD